MPDVLARAIRQEKRQKTSRLEGKKETVHHREVNFYTEDPKNPTKTIINEFDKITRYKADVKKNNKK